MRRIIITVAALAAAILPGCVEDPKPVGGALVDAGNISTLSTVTVPAVSDTSFVKPPVNGFGGSDLTGRTAGDETVTALFKFLPASALDSLRSASLDTVELRLTVNYRLQPAGSPLVFELHEILQSWSQGSVTADSLPLSGIGTDVLATFSDSMNYGQTVVAPVDTSAARRWIESNSDTSSPRFYGFAVQPRAGDVPGIIGFTTFSEISFLLPEFVIKYTTPFGTHDSLIVQTGEDTFLASSTASSPLMSEIRGGFGVLTRVQFDVSAITGHPTVNKAVLTLHADTTRWQKSGYAPDSAIVFFGLPDTAAANDYSTSMYSYGSFTRDSAGRPAYQFAVTSLSQLWINGRNLNEGFVIGWLALSGSADRVVFHRASDADLTLRPSMKFYLSNQQ